MIITTIDKNNNSNENYFFPIYTFLFNNVLFLLRTITIRKEYNFVCIELTNFEKQRNELI